MARMAQVVMHGKPIILKRELAGEWHHRPWRVAKAKLTADWRADPAVIALTCAVSRVCRLAIRPACSVGKALR